MAHRPFASMQSPVARLLGQPLNLPPLTTSFGLSPSHCATPSLASAGTSGLLCFQSMPDHVPAAPAMKCSDSHNQKSEHVHEATLCALCLPVIALRVNHAQMAALESERRTHHHRACMKPMPGINGSWLLAPSTSTHQFRSNDHPSVNEHTTVSLPPLQVTLTCHRT